jgi:hypothetical protein
MKLVSKNLSFNHEFLQVSFSFIDSHTLLSFWEKPKSRFCAAKEFIIMMKKFED